MSKLNVNEEKNSVSALKTEEKRQQETIVHLVKRIRGETGLRFCVEIHNNGRYTIGLMSTKLGMNIMAYKVSYDGAFTALQAMQKLLRVEAGQKVGLEGVSA